MGDNGKLAWYGRQVEAIIDKATPKALARVAFQVEGQAKVNARDNGQLDTSFMINSTYSVTEEGPFFDGSPGTGSPSGQYASSKSGRPAPRRRNEAVPTPPRGGAAVHAAAEYAAYQEMRKSWLYQALEQVVPAVKGIVEGLLAEVLP